MSVRPSSAATISLVFILWLNLCFVRPREARETGVQPYGAGGEGPDKEVVRFRRSSWQSGSCPNRHQARGPATGGLATVGMRYAVVAAGRLRRPGTRAI